MAVVIRLQGLRVAAGSEDIRKFFTGLRIPDGGVHIIGGDREEAFIIFASDEDARRAMTRSGGSIKGGSVQLLLSSKTEMQAVLERSTRNMELAQTRQFEEAARHVRRPVDPEEGRRPPMRMGPINPPQNQRAPEPEDAMFMFLRGMPFSVTEDQVREFFSGLNVDDIVLLKNSSGLINGKAFVKFATVEDALEGRKRDKGYIGSRYVEVMPTTVNEWCRLTGKPAMPMSMNQRFERDRSPIRNQRNPPPQARSQSPIGPRSIAPSDEEYCVLMENMPYTAEKEDIKRLFRNANLEDDHILHLHDSDGRRTRSTFVLFRSLRDYCEALTQEKRLFHNRWVSTRPISREKMISLLQSPTVSESRPPGNPERFQERPQSYNSDPYDSEKVCLYVQNLPFDVRKVEIMDFFYGSDIAEDKVFVLQDHKGAGAGKALILFRSEAEAQGALARNGERFLGSEVLLKCITRPQMRQLGVNPSEVQEPRMRRDEFSGRMNQNEPPYHPGNNDMPPNPNFRGFDDRMPAPAYRDDNYEPFAGGPYPPQERGNGVHRGFGPGGPGGQHSDGPTCVQLLNLPFQIQVQEIYDFCYGYHIIPGSVSLQYEPSGRPQGTATAVFHSRQEALTVINELSGRPIGPRKIQLVLA